MKKIAAIKKAVTVVVGLGVSKIVNDIIAENVDVDRTYQKVTVPVAAFAIGGAVAEASSKYTDGFIDEVVTTWYKIKDRKTAE